MINWIYFAGIAALLWAFVNHLDKYLLDKYCKSREIGGLLIFSGLIGLPVCTTILLFQPTILSGLTPDSLIIVFAGALYILGLLPYLYALEGEETSIVAPQMLLTPIFAALLGYFILGELLSINQIAGGAVLLIGSLFLSLDIKDLLNIKLNTKVLFLMALSTFAIALHFTLFKYFAIEMSFWKTVFWTHVGYLAVTVYFLIFHVSFRTQFLKLLRVNSGGIITINVISEIITLLGNLAFHYSALFIQIAVSELVTEGLQPFFVVVIGIFITLFFPKIAQENITPKHLLHKFLSILIMVLGLYLMVA